MAQRFDFSTLCVLYTVFAPREMSLVDFAWWVLGLIN